MSTIFTANIVESTTIDIFLEEFNLVSNFWAEKMDKEKSFSEDDESIQTSNRLRCLPKNGMKVNMKTCKTGQPKKK